MTEKTTVGGIPVECFTGEAAAIWTGWRTLGDRELVREAAAKGNHIELAHKCLAFRKNCSIGDAQLYFNREVEHWVIELLKNRQIYRASHILKHVNKNPLEYIFEICISCTDSNLRNYLSDYLINIAHFDSEHINSLHLIKSIIQFEQEHMIEGGLSTSLCIKTITKLPDIVKYALSTELYFSFADDTLLKNIRNNVVWDYLLSNNRIEMIRFWIDIFHNGTIESNEIDEKYKSLFATLDITPSMIEAIDSSNASSLIKELTKNHLCRYGLLVQKEQKDLKLLLARIYSSAMTVSIFKEKLSHKSCTLNKAEFTRRIDKELCLAYCSNQIDIPEDRAKISELYDVLKIMCDTQGQCQDVLTEGIFKTIHYLTNDINEYLKQNYFIVLVLIFSYVFKENNHDKDSNIKDNRLWDIFRNTDVLQLGTYNISREILENTLNCIPILQSVVENKPRKEVTMYELLDGYKNLNVKQLYKWRFNNEPMPHFSNESLVKKYGYVEALTYEYYLKKARPNMAIFSLKHSQGKLLGNVSCRQKSRAALYAHILALRNLNKSEILCTCISFIEMLGIDSTNLRLYITAANYVHNEINVSIGSLLENIIYRNESDLKIVMSYLESSFHRNLTDNLTKDGKQFINTLKTWDVIVQFAKVHDFPLPVTLLKFLAGKNLWFEFVLVCNIFSYPLNQVLENTKHFKDIVLREHLLTCLNNIHLTKSQIICGEQKLKSRDTRQSLYYKIGVKQTGSSIVDSSTSTDTTSTVDCPSICEYTASDSIYSTDDDLWSIILKCHQSPDPPGALIHSSQITLRPFLTVLATCYEPSSTAAYCYSWIVISSADQEILSNYKECLDHQLWTPRKISLLLCEVVSRGYINMLSKAFQIFMPENLLNAFFEFLTQCAIFGDFKGCEQKLLDFEVRCLNLKCNKAMDWDCSDPTYLNNLHWVIMVATKCLIATLAHVLKSTHLQVKFLEVLVRCNCHTNFPVYTPNFQLFLKIVKILQKTDINVNFSDLIASDNTYNIDAEIQRCINHLLRTENYDNALELANVTQFNASDIILAKYRSKFRHCLYTNDKIEDNFWNECALRFKVSNVPYEKAVEFFIEHAEKVSSHKERYEILKLAYETLKNIKTEQENINTLEVAMWKSCILAGPENVPLDTGPNVFSKLKTELLYGLHELKFGYTLNNEHERKATEVLINKLIDLGNLDTALRICTIFNCKHKDLQILMLCLSLAENEISVNELTTEQQNLLKQTNKNKQQKYSALKNRSLQRFSSSSSLTITTCEREINKPKYEAIHKLQMECLSTLQKALHTLEHGLDICTRILLCYKLSIQLGKSYQLLLTLNKPIQFLQEIIESDIRDKSEIINDIISAYKISNDTIATFLAENITINISRAVEDGNDDNISLWGYSINTNFRIIMELCNDVSLLGWQLLKIARKLLGDSHGENRNVSTLKTAVELLIRAHDCFTTSCNMEGIASILRKCQNLANVLQNFKCWTLLVRLVTGVGRFTEMNYIFQILKENDQFEFVLGKGLDKVPGLKTALLEFLKRYCPENKDLFTLVALHFRLYQEIAIMWENEAKDVIKVLLAETIKDQGKAQNTLQQEIKLSKTENVQKQLQLAIVNYTHATQYYLQANKLNLVSQCSDQVQLVTLQLSLLNTVSYNQQVISILNLKSEDIDKVLSQNLSFSQALIIVHAYNHHVDWANLIYSHCILNGEIKYFKDFIAVNKLTPSLVQDCARRYRLEKSITHTMTDNMKILISELSDVECKYVLASQLGFKNIVEIMLNNPMIGAYLKDVVWKKGHNAI